MPENVTRFGQLENADWVIILRVPGGLGRSGHLLRATRQQRHGCLLWRQRQPSLGGLLEPRCWSPALRPTRRLWIGDIIYKRGLEGAWFYWAPAIGTAFFILLIAPLWKRCGDSH